MSVHSSKHCWYSVIGLKHECTEINMNNILRVNSQLPAFSFSSACFRCFVLLCSLVSYEEWNGLPSPTIPHKKTEDPVFHLSFCLCEGLLLDLRMAEHA